MTPHAALTTDNGKDYGPQVQFLDAGYFAAGNGGCIGLKILSWSDTRVVFQFGNSYHTFEHWYVTAGDSYDITLVGKRFTGTITFLVAPNPVCRQVHPYSERSFAQREPQGHSSAQDQGDQ